MRGVLRYSYIPSLIFRLDEGRGCGRDMIQIERRCVMDSRADRQIIPASLEGVGVEEEVILGRSWSASQKWVFQCAQLICITPSAQISTGNAYPCLVW